MGEQRLIDANGAKKRILDYAKELHNKENAADGYVMFAASIIDNLPTIEAEPVRHGKWESFDCEYWGTPDTGYTCSECGRQEFQKEPYCNCGAKMDKE